MDDVYSSPFLMVVKWTPCGWSRCGGPALHPAVSRFTQRCGLPFIRWLHAAVKFLFYSVFLLTYFKSPGHFETANSTGLCCNMVVHAVVNIFIFLLTQVLWSYRGREVEVQSIGLWYCLNGMAACCSEHLFFNWLWSFLSSRETKGLWGAMGLDALWDSMGWRASGYVIN